MTNFWKASVVLAMFQCWYADTFIMQPIASLQRTAGKANSKNFKGAMRTEWKIYSSIFFQLCIMITIFQVATLLSIVSTTTPSLSHYRKSIKSNYIFTYANWNINLIVGFQNYTWFYYLSHVFFISAVFVIHLL